MVGLIEVALDLLEALVHDGDHAVVLAVNGAGLQSGEQLTQADDLSGGAQILHNADVDGVVGHTELLAGKVIHTGQRLAGGEGTGGVGTPGEQLHLGEELVEVGGHLVGHLSGPHILGVLQIAVQEGPVGDEHLRELLVHGGAHHHKVHGAVTDALPQVGLVAQQAVVVDLHGELAVGLLLDLGLEHIVQRRGHGVAGTPVVADAQGLGAAAAALAAAAAAAGRHSGNHTGSQENRDQLFHFHVTSS